MGSVMSTRELIVNVGDFVTGRKRRRSETEEKINTLIDSVLHTPKRKKIISTPEYIYRALFEEGQNSDITVCALGEEFYLHKIYLCQSPYFASMFGGSWLETSKKYISIDIIDPHISVNSLKIVFGSLYNNEVYLNPMEIISVLATSTLFQLDTLIEKCSEVMFETINPKTALEYYNASCCYGDRKLQQFCFQWFLVNLMTYFFTNTISSLRDIPIDLMTKLVEHKDLFVVQTEYSLYVMLKYWMYILVHSSEDVCTKEINNFYTSRTGDTPYLLTKEGEQFKRTFQGLRLHNLISHHMDLESLLKDNIIPKEWVNRVVLDEWKKLLRVNQNEDSGPTNISDELFFSTSLRCGRVLSESEKHIWRWTGFHFGIDLLILIDGRTLSVRRNHRSDSEQLLSFQNVRSVAIKVTIAKLNDQRQIVFSKSSEVLRLNLTKGEQVQIMSLDKDLEYPIILSACILYTSINTQGKEEEVIQTIS